MSLSERMPFVRIMSAERRMIFKSDFPQDIFSGKEVVRFRQSTVFQLLKWLLKVTKLQQLSFDVLHQILSCVQTQYMYVTEQNADNQFDDKPDEEQ